MIGSQVSIVLQSLVDDIPNIWILHVTDYGLDVSLHEVLNDPLILLPSKPVWNPVTTLGPNQSVASHLHAIRLGIVLNTIASTEIIFALNLGNHVHLA